MVRIITDSSADIPIVEAKKLNIDIVSLSIHFEGKVYTQEEDTDFSRFYELLRTAKKLPKTSQPSPEAFEKAYREAIARGDTEIVVITLSSGLSGTFQSATIAKGMVPEIPVYIVDSKTAIGAQRILIEHAIRLRDQGVSGKEIAAAIDALRSRAQIWGMVDTLTYLHRGGRLPLTTAIVGNLLKIKPIITLNAEGVIGVVGKGRNDKAIVTQFVDGPAYDPEFPVYFGYTGVDDTMKRVKEQILASKKIEKVGVYPIGSLIGTHVGPNCVAISFIRK